MSEDTVEIHLCGVVKDSLLVKLKSSIVPRSGEYIVISQKTYKVEFVSYAVDDLHPLGGLRANVEVSPRKIPNYSEESNE